MAEAVEEQVDQTIQERTATFEDFSTRGGLEHITDKNGWSILTSADPGATPLSPEENATRLAQLREELDANGLEFHDAMGQYGDRQPSIIVLGLTELQARDIGSRWGQESVLTNRGLIYTDGTNRITRPCTAYRKDRSAVDQLWKRYTNGEITQEEARAAFVGRYAGPGGFPLPDWAHAGRGGGVVATTSYESGLHRGERLGGTVGPRAGGDDAAAPATLDGELGRSAARGHSAITLTEVHFSQKARAELDGRQYRTGLSFKPALSSKELRQPVHLASLPQTNLGYRGIKMHPPPDKWRHKPHANSGSRPVGQVVSI